VPTIQAHLRSASHDTTVARLGSAQEQTLNCYSLSGSGREERRPILIKKELTSGKTRMNDKTLTVTDATEAARVINLFDETHGNSQSL
jgi:hypothetical protein